MYKVQIYYSNFLDNKLFTFLNYEFFFLIDGKTLVDKALFIVLLFFVSKFKAVMKFRDAKENRSR